MKSDQALEIDCPDILEHAGVQNKFLKGFVVIQSALELDVVAVYTAAEWHVESMHTERVPYRNIGIPEPVKPEPKYCEQGGLGDPVGREGCCCNKPRVNPPMSAADYWPDCKQGLTCVGNLAGPGIHVNTYSACVSRPMSGINPQIHSSQPAFCGQR